MCTLGDIFPWAVLALFLSTGLAAPQTKSTVPVTVNSAESGINNKSVLPCAAPPTVFTSLPFEFWIETIVLGPIPPDFDVLYDPRQGNPVAFQQPIWPFFPNLEISYSTSFVAQTGQPRELFTLYSGRLDNTKRNDAQIWPYPDDDYPGYQPLAWDVEADRDNIQLKFEAYKACSPINEVELRLRARRRNPLSGLSPKEETEMGFSAPETVGPYVEFGASSESGRNLNFFVKTDLNTTTKLIPIKFRVRPLLPAKKPEPISLEGLGKNFE